MNIGLDFDGVITDCSILKAEVAERMFGIIIQPENFKKEFVIGKNILTLSQYVQLQKEVYDSREFGLLAKMVSGTKEYIERLQDENHIISIITSRSNEGLEITKTLLQKFKIDVPVYGVTYPESKLRKAQELQLDVFIDDDYEKLEDLIGVIPHLFLFSWTYNIHISLPQEIVRTFSWEDFYKKIQSLR